jgi:hypothetical protein
MQRTGVDAAGCCCKIAATLGGEAVVEPPRVVEIVALLMSMKSQVLRVIFRTPGRVDVEPPSIADSLRKCAVTSPRAWQGTVDVDVVDDVEDEVVDFFFLGFSGLSEQSANFLFSLVFSLE